MYAYCIPIGTAFCNCRRRLFRPARTAKIHRGSPGRPPPSPRGYRRSLRSYTNCVRTPKRFLLRSFHRTSPLRADGPGVRSVQRRYPSTGIGRRRRHRSNWARRERSSIARSRSARESAIIANAGRVVGEALYECRSGCPLLSAAHIKKPTIGITVRTEDGDAAA